MGKGQKRAPLSAADIERGLKALGFEERPKKGTSHTQWAGQINGHFRKVTVDAHHEPFSDDLTKSMANQAGISVKQFYEVCSKDGAKKAKKGLLSWLVAIVVPAPTED